MILLDLDGPLLDGKLRHFQCYSDILVAHGYNFLNTDTYWEMKRNRVSKREQLAASGAESIYETYLDEWLENIETPEYLSLDRLQEDAQKTLAKWKTLGHMIVVVTMRNNRKTLMQQLQSIGLLTYFSNVLVTKHVNGGVGKALAVLEHYPEINPELCLWVGDTEVDVEAARYLHCPVWLLTCGLRTKLFLQSLKPEFLSENITQIDFEKVNL